MQSSLKAIFKDLEALALRAAGAAACVLQPRVASALTASNGPMKHNKDVKLEADILAHEQVMECLLQGSDFPILSEEDVCEQEGLEETFWVVDPLDGTANYARGMDSCVCIALMHLGKPVLGVTHVLGRQAVYTGSQLTPAQKNGQRIYTRKQTNANEACLLTGPGDYARQLEQMPLDFRRYQTVRVLGSAGLSAVLVAEGVADCYQEYQRKLWDIASGWAIVEAAGGAVTATQTAHLWEYDIVMSGGRKA